jgi:hypothetical protein
MTTEELVERLRGLIGRKVSIQSSIIHGPAGAILGDVTVVDGRVWVHTQDGVSWVVDKETVEIEIEDVDGTRDFASVNDVGGKVAEFRTRYGAIETELRRKCQCYVCEGRRKGKEDERGAKLREGYVEKMGCEPVLLTDIDWRYEASEIRERDVAKKDTDVRKDDEEDNGGGDTPFTFF